MAQELTTRTVVVEIKFFFFAISALVQTENCKLDLPLDSSARTQMEKNIRRMYDIEESSRRRGNFT